MATLLHGKDSKDSNVAIWRYMARMRKEERMQKGARQWCIIPVPQSASATFSLAASKMSICPDQKSKTFPAQKMHCKRSAILKMVLSHGFNWNPLPEWQVSLACNLFFWQRGVFLISREQMKEKCPACSEQSINTFYHQVRYKRASPLSKCSICSWQNWCMWQLAGDTLIKFNWINSNQINSPFIPNPYIFLVALAS